MIARIGLSVAFFASVFFCPWWLTIILGILLLSLFEAGVLVIIGGICMDLVFGAPMVSFGGFQYLYTALFFMLVIFSWYLHRTLSE